MTGARVVLIIGHGRQESLGHHLARVLLEELERRGAECRVHDLLADGFDPVLRLTPGQSSAEEVDAADEPLVACYQRDVRWADSYAIVHPVWWFAPPALLKGWVDRVFADRVAVDHNDEPPRGLLTGRRALVVQTFKAPRAVDRLLTGRLSARFWTRAVFAPAGVRDVTVLGLYGAKPPWEKRLERFERTLRKRASHLIPEAAKPSQ